MARIQGITFAIVWPIIFLIYVHEMGENRLLRKMWLFMEIPILPERWENILPQNRRAINVSNSTVSVWSWKNKFGAKGFHGMTNFHNRRRRICIKRIRILVKLWNEQQNKFRWRIKGWNNGMKAVKSFIPKNTFTRRIHHIRYGLHKNSREIVRSVIKGTERSQKLFWKRFNIGNTHIIQIWMKHTIKSWWGQGSQDQYVRVFDR